MARIYCEDSTCKYRGNITGCCMRDDVQIVIGQDDHLNTICVCDDYEKKEDKDGN